MEISSKFVGMSLKTLASTITWRQTMNYAAATGDNQPLYFDDERPEGIIAPPMFAVCVTWPISERILDFIEAADFPQEIILTQVHYTEDLSFYRPIRPGDHLLIRGKVSAILPHRSGTVVVLRFDGLDSENKLVFTEHIGSLMRGVKCADGGGGKDDLPLIPEQPKISETIWEVNVPVHALAPFIYDGCTNICFPIHTSVRFAHDVGLPGIILQGTATLAYAVRELTNQEAGGRAECLKSLHCRFAGMVRPGSDIKVRLHGRKSNNARTQLFFTVLNAKGQKAISDGVAVFKH